MHELSLCQNLIDQLTTLTRQHQAVGVGRVELRVGQLSGVESALLETAFGLARPGTVAASAELVTHLIPPHTLCQDCGMTAIVEPNDLRCPTCGGSDTELVDGHELILARVELLQAAD
jgi:hydrogenase nickel incorporation protein HypA/HybF